jgi:hypothetical protein
MRNKRDKDIIESLGKFRVLDRDQLISLHFNDVKQKVVTCNRVMKRLRDQNFVEHDPTFNIYNYFLKPSPIKKTSSKLLHYKAIADFVIEAKKLGNVTDFDVEVKLGEKGTVEPDLFMIWNNAPFFVEVQLSNYYSKNYMEKKLERYKEYYDQGNWRGLPWQQEKKKFFPYVLIICDHTYNVQKPPLKIFQAKSMTDFVSRYAKQQK